MRPEPTRRPLIGQDEAEHIAVSALAFLSADDDRLGRFLDTTGLSPDRMREAATEPGFLSAVLDYLVGDDELIVGLARELGIRPEEVARAQQVLSPGGESF